MEVGTNFGVLVGIIFLIIEIYENTIATQSEPSLALESSTRWIDSGTNS